MRADLVLVEHLKVLAQALEPRQRHLVEAAAARIKQLAKAEPRVKLRVMPPITTTPMKATLPAAKESHHVR